MYNEKQLKEKKDLFVLICHMNHSKSSYQEAAAWHGLPAGSFESFAQEETFAQWLTSILDGKPNPGLIDKYNDIYALIKEFEPARQWVTEAVQAEPKGIWAMMDAMGPMMPHSAAELLADYLVTHPIAKSHILPAMKQPVPGCPELNPEGLERIERLLDRSWEEQLWFFLEDSIPHDILGVWLTFNPERACITENGTVCGVTEANSANIDWLYSEKPSVWDISEAGLERMLPCLPLLKACYHPYEWNLTVTGLTEKEQNQLAELMAKGSCRGTVKDIAKELIPEAIVIPATFSVTIGSTCHTADGFLYTEDDRPEDNEEC